MKDSFGMDSKMARHCIEANIRNNLTSFYHLLMKKKKLEGKALRDESQHSLPIMQESGSISIIIQDPIG
jgi:hypothetical protein